MKQSFAHADAVQPQPIGPLPPAYDASALWRVPIAPLFASPTTSPPRKAERSRNTATVIASRGAPILGAGLGGGGRA
jgi:hypothetical protein